MSHAIGTRHALPSGPQRPARAPDQQRRVARESVRDVGRRAVVDAVHEQPERALERRERRLAALLLLQQACAGRARRWPSAEPRHAVGPALSPGNVLAMGSPFAAAPTPAGGLPLQLTLPCS